MEKKDENTAGFYVTCCPGCGGPLPEPFGNWRKMLCKACQNALRAGREALRILEKDGERPEGVPEFVELYLRGGKSLQLDARGNLRYRFDSIISPKENK